MSFWNDKKVLVTGAHGFVGHAVIEQLKNKNCLEVIAPSRAEYDLTIETEVEKLFSRKKPNVVLHLAGKVGGIGANRAAQGDFFYQNLMMGTLVLEKSKNHNVQKVVALAAGCGYPKHLEVPYRESDFWSSLPDENSVGYSMAKKMLIIQSWTYREQYGFDSTILLPANLFGPHDNFNLESSHVVPALIRKIVEAKNAGDSSVEVWGTGAASREFLYVEDTAKAIIDTAEISKISGPLNLGTGQETSIKELVELIKEIVDYDGQILWNKSKPDGQPRRFYDMKKFEKELGYLPSTELYDGLAKTIKWYQENREEILRKNGS